MVCIKAWHSVLLNEGCLEGLPDQDRVIFTVSDENLDVLRHGSLESSSSALSFHLPTLQLVLINRDRLRQDFATSVLNFRFVSWFLLQARDQVPETIQL